MDKIEKAKYESNGRVLIFLTAHDAALILISLYAEIKSRFLTNKGLLEEAIQKQAAEIKMFAATKRMAKYDIAECVIKFAIRGYLQVKSLGKTELMMSLDHVISYINRASSELALTRAKELKKIMSENNGILTELTTADFTEMDEKMQQYSDLVFMPKSEIKKRKAEGTKRIATIQKEVDVDKDDIGKLIQSYLPELLTGYTEAVKVGKPAGRRHTSLILHVVDAVSGAPLRYVGGTITNGITVYKRKTTKDGYIRLYSLENALWNVTVEKNDYETFIQEEVGTEEKNIVTLEIRLKKKPLREAET
jgi:hypothetical protein